MKENELKIIHASPLRVSRRVKEFLSKHEDIIKSQVTWKLDGAKSALNPRSLLILSMFILLHVLLLYLVIRFLYNNRTVKFYKHYIQKAIPIYYSLLQLCKK